MFQFFLFIIDGTIRLSEISSPNNFEWGIRFIGIFRKIRLVSMENFSVKYIRNMSWFKWTINSAYFYVKRPGLI